jgi:hypothetical protein
VGRRQPEPDHDGVAHQKGQPSRVALQVILTAGGGPALPTSSPGTPPDTWLGMPLSELTSGRLERFLSVIDQWIAGVRTHAKDGTERIGVAAGFGSTVESKVLTASVESLRWPCRKWRESALLATKRGQ